MSKHFGMANTKFKRLMYLQHNRLSCTKIEGKFFVVHIMKAYGGSRGITPLILNLGTLDAGEWLT
jgi:hypothetical protein